MPFLEILILLLFLGVVAATYVLAARAVLALLRRRWRNVPGGAARLSPLHRTALVLAALGTILILYGHFVEPRWLAVTHVRISSGKIPPGTSPIRIVQISDIHAEAAPGLEASLPAIITSEKPDLIVFTGDAANCREGIPVFQRCMTRIAAIAPTLAVRGNWDIRKWKDIPLFENTGVRELDGDAVPIAIRGVVIGVAGVASRHEDRIPAAMQKLPANAFSLFLYHYTIPERVADPRIDLIISGHTHGGQVALPFYGALITLSPHGKRYESGLYPIGNAWLYVNRGIGMEGGFAPRVRFFARPELTVFEIIPNGNPAMGGAR
ncbi:MAG: metallophosphoesterase [Planctomycetota bacterium]